MSDYTAPQGEAIPIAHALDRDPMVARARAGLPAALIVALFALLAIGLFMVLNARRLDHSVAPTIAAPVTAMASPPPPLEIPTPPPQPQPAPPQLIAPPPPPPPPMAPRPQPVDDTIQQHLHAPAVVVDLQAGAPLAPAAPMKEQTSPPAAAEKGAGTTEQFAARVSQANAEVSVATQMANLKTTIVQGATIQALLETALNSDLPGYVRAVVRQDVLGFDGKAVLIPRGSRVIGQYRNAMSLGQSRVFIIWSRVIRPDGVTVQIGSPGGDALGRGGLTGDVDTHFFARFGGAILLSVLNAGVNAVSHVASTQIAIGSPAAALGAAATAVPPGDIAPTIEVEQGAAVTIFVARDLDFSAVKPLP